MMQFIDFVSSIKIDPLIMVPVIVITSFLMGIMMLFYGMRDKSVTDKPDHLLKRQYKQILSRLISYMMTRMIKLMTKRITKLGQKNHASIDAHHDDNDNQPPPFWRLSPGLSAASSRPHTLKDREQLFYPINYHDQNLSSQSNKQSNLDDRFESDRARLLSAKSNQKPQMDGRIDQPTPKNTPKNAPDHIYDHIHDYTDAQIHELLHDCLRHNRIDSFVQPITSLPGRHILAFEFFGRIRSQDGAYIPAARFFNMAQRDGVLSKIDNAILINCLQFLKRQDAFHQKIKNQAANVNHTDAKQAHKSYFLNISPHTLADAQFMSGLLQFLGKNKHISRLIILEMRDQDIRSLPNQLRLVLHGLSQIGVRFSLSDFDTITSAISNAKEYKIDFIKLPAAMISQIMDRGFGARNGLIDQLHELQEIGITAIADKVENDMVLDMILDLPISMAQGYLFGRPAVPNTYQDSLPLARAN